MHKIHLDQIHIFEREPRHPSTAYSAFQNLQETDTRQIDIVGSQYVRVKDEHKKDNYLFSGIRLSMLSDFKGLNNSEDQIFQKGQTDGIFTVKGC